MTSPLSLVAAFELPSNLLWVGAAILLVVGVFKVVRFLIVLGVLLLLAGIAVRVLL